MKIVKIIGIYSLCVMLMGGCRSKSSEVDLIGAENEPSQAIVERNDNDSNQKKVETQNKTMEQVTKIKWKAVFEEPGDFFHLYITVDEKTDHYVDGYWPGVSFALNEDSYVLDAPESALSTLSTLWTGEGQWFYIYQKSDTELAVMNHPVIYPQDYIDSVIYEIGEEAYTKQYVEYQEVLTVPIEKGCQVQIEETVIVLKPDYQTIISPTEDFDFSDLSDLKFWFGSGVGAWSTVVEINEDGAFNGYYSDMNMGDYGPDYPFGTRYECYFSGIFTSLSKISEYEYSMKCDKLTVEREAGLEEIIDNVRIITADPYGFDDADEFLLYLPGKRHDDLPFMFLAWVHIDPENVVSEDNGVLAFYGLYNVGGEQGFISYEK